MAIWNNVMQAPIGQTGFAIQNRVGTGIRIEPIDPRMFMYGGSTSGGTKGLSAGSKSSKGTSTSEKDFKANTGAYRSISEREYLLGALDEQLDKSYIETITSGDDVDVDALDKEYYAAKAEVQAGRRGVMMSKNMAVIMRGQYDDLVKDIAGREKSLAFTSSLGQLATVDDFLDLSYDTAGNLQPIVAIGRDMKSGAYSPLTLEVYASNYDEFSRMEGDDSVTRLVRPNTEISTSKEFNDNLRKILKDAAYQDVFQQAGTENVAHLNDYLKHLLKAKAEGQNISLNLIEQATNKYNIQEASNAMWESLNAADRAYALSEVLKKPTGQSLLMKYEATMAAYDHTLRDGTKALKEGEDKESAVERLYSEAAEIAGQILLMGKMYAHGVADVNMKPLIGITEKLLSSEDGALGKFVKETFPEATHLQGLVAKMQTMQHSQSVYMMGLNENSPADIIGPSDIWGTKAGTLSHYDKQVLAQHFGFKPHQENDDERNYATVAFSPSYVYMNGVAVDLNNLDVGKDLHQMSKWRTNQTNRSEHSAKNIRLTNKFGNYIVDMPLMHQINNEEFGGVLIDPIWAAPGINGEGVPYLGEFVAVNIEVDGNFPLVISKDKNDGTVVFEQIDNLKNSPEHQAAYNFYKVKKGIKDSSKRYTVEVLVRLSDFETPTNFLNVRDSYHAADTAKEQVIMDNDRNIRNAESERRKADIAYKKENVYNQAKVMATTDVRFFYDMFDFTESNEVSYKGGEIPKLNEIQKIESIIDDLVSNEVLKKPDVNASEKQLKEIQSGNIGTLNIIDKEINIKEISNLINVLRIYIQRQSTFTGGSQGINYYKPNYRP